MKSKCKPTSVWPLLQRSVKFCVNRTCSTSACCLALAMVISLPTTYAKEMKQEAKRHAANTAAHNDAKHKPKIKQFPNTPVWSDPDLAAKEFSGFAFIGEYLKGEQALQVTTAAGKFYLSIYQGGLPGAGWDGGPIEHHWVEADAIEQHLSGWEKVDRSKDVTGKQPPANAIVLFDGSNTTSWNNGRLDRGYLKAGTRTKQKFKDFRLYYEFLVPLKPEPPISHPHRGNSGVFAVGAYEIQIADTFGIDPNLQVWKEGELLKPVDTWCGSIYGIRAPDLHMCLPPLKWQSMEVEFKAARFKDGAKVSPAVISIIHNGVKVHEDVSLPEGTGGGPAGPQTEVPEGPIYLQHHGNPNLFRNIWIVPNQD